MTIPITPLTETQTDEMLLLSPHALRRWRFEGKGPKWLKLGSAVRYKLEDVGDWLRTLPSGGSDAPVERKEAA